MSSDAPNKEACSPANGGCGCSGGTPASGALPPGVVTVEAPAPTTRRNFLFQIGIALNLLAGALISIPLIGFVLSTFIQKFPLQWISLGSLEKFPVGQVRLAQYLNPYRRTWDGETAHIPCWVRRIDEAEFQVFAINCTHLGCPVRWFAESKLFMCPCHGGAFYENGDHAAGPPPRGLFTYEYRVLNGNLEIKGGILPTLANPGNPTEKVKEA